MAAIALLSHAEHTFTATCPESHPEQTETFQYFSGEQLKTLEHGRFEDYLEELKRKACEHPISLDAAYRHTQQQPNCERCNELLALAHLWTGQVLGDQDAQLKSDCLQFAISYLDGAIRDKTDRIDLWEMYAMAHFSSGEGQRALDILNEGLQHHPNDIQLGSLLGGTLSSEKRGKEAMAVFKTLAEAHPKEFEVCWNYARCCDWYGTPKEALKAYNQCLRIAAAPWEKATSIQGRAESLFKLGRHSEALTDYKTLVALEESWNLWEALQGVAKVLQAQSGAEEALRYLDTAVLERPDNDVPLLVRADFCETHSCRDLGRSDLLRVVELYERPGYYPTHSLVDRESAVANLINRAEEARVRRSR